MSSSARARPRRRPKVCRERPDCRRSTHRGAPHLRCADRARFQDRRRACGRRWCRSSVRRAFSDSSVPCAIWSCSNLQRAHQLDRLVERLRREAAEPTAPAPQRSAAAKIGCAAVSWGGLAQQNLDAAVRGRLGIARQSSACGRRSLRSPRPASRRGRRAPACNRPSARGRWKAASCRSCRCGTAAHRCARGW